MMWVKKRNSKEQQNIQTSKFLLGCFWRGHVLLLISSPPEPYSPYQWAVICVASLLNPGTMRATSTLSAPILLGSKACPRGATTASTDPRLKPLSPHPTPSAQLHPSLLPPIPPFHLSIFLSLFISWFGSFRTKRTGLLSRSQSGMRQYQIILFEVKNTFDRLLFFTTPE